LAFAASAVPFVVTDGGFADSNHRAPIRIVSDSIGRLHTFASPPALPAPRGIRLAANPSFLGILL